MENPRVATEEKGAWPIIFKITVIIGAVAAIVAAVVPLYDFLNRKEPLLLVSTRISPGYDVPLNRIQSLSDQINLDYKKEFEASLSKDEAEKLKPNVELLAKIDAFMSKIQKDQRKAFLDVATVKQSAGIYVQNSGDKQAENVVIQLPFATTGLYRVDTQQEHKPFERTIELGTVRPGTLIMVTVWLNAGSLTEGDIKASYSEGIIPVRPLASYPSGLTYMDVVLYFALAFSSIVLFAIAILLLYAMSGGRRLAIVKADPQPLQPLDPETPKRRQSRKTTTGKQT